ncbi:MAG: GtrA family protein [Deltaproteobacteria bacterium]|nr:GtrA family protein [Deltaproteobacteria bacterium]
MIQNDRSAQFTWNRIKTLVKQFFKFGMVGVSNTVLSIVIYNGLLFAGVHYIIAYTIAFLISVINAYIWNRKFVFKASAGGGKRTFLKVFLSYGSTFLLGMALLYILVQYAGISKSLAQILLLLITIPANFLLNKLWAFNEKI